MKEVTVIVPVSNSMPHLETMLGCLYSSTSFPFKLIIIESESTDFTNVFVDEFAKHHSNVQVVHTKKEGLTKAINLGIRLAGDTDVYITQDDVIHFRLYGRDWLAEMWKLAKDKKIGVITCLNGGGISGQDYVDGMRWVGTWAIYLPRHTIDTVGFFDEKMSPGDDIDYCYRIGLAKLKGCMTDYWVQHHRLTEHGDVDTKAKQLKMSKYFKAKWGLNE